MYKIIHLNEQIEELQKQLIKSFSENLQTIKLKATVWGKKDKTIYYNHKFDIWLYHEINDDNKEKLKYLNGFGIGKPMGETAIIDCQINFPVDATLGNKLAGRFASDNNGNIAILHTGKIGKIKKVFFWQNYSGNCIEAYDNIEYAFVGKHLKDNFGINQIADFTKEIIRIKKLNKQQIKS